MDMLALIKMGLRDFWHAHCFAQLIQYGGSYQRIEDVPIDYNYTRRCGGVWMKFSPRTQVRIENGWAVPFSFEPIRSGELVITHSTSMD